MTLVPRAVQRPGATPSHKPPAVASGSTGAAAGEGSDTGAKAMMSNNDFRKMLLK